ncbi:hypothetical protein E2562_017597 [Oryza meyeriana var. granulata]|uniref:Uncharacterized protein n=1 Tax=Oryza meyeriana var. granulata TaxID=110450 RepID=A0A6G1BLZ7_9ORYZ|nr:hypothetical protein E2562_017597 [Oryza meyeriana var. granulata]
MHKGPRGGAWPGPVQAREGTGAVARAWFSLQPERCGAIQEIDTTFSPLILEWPKIADTKKVPHCR